MKKYIEKEHDYNEKKLLKKQAKKQAKLDRKFNNKITNSPNENIEKNHLDQRLICEIEDKSFWEDMTSIIREGANPCIKTSRGDDIQIGLITIFEAWDEMAFSASFKWDDSDGKIRIDYLKKEIDKMINWGVDINASPENKGSYLSSGNLFYIVSIAALRYPALLELSLHMFEKGADINVKFNSGFNKGTLREYIERRQILINSKEDKKKINILLSLDEKRQLTKNMTENNIINTDVKVVKRL